jgi:hypothetical protein
VISLSLSLSLSSASHLPRLSHHRLRLARFNSPTVEPGFCLPHLSRHRLRLSGFNSSTVEPGFRLPRLSRHRIRLARFRHRLPLATFNMESTPLLLCVLSLFTAQGPRLQGQSTRHIVHTGAAPKLPSYLRQHGVF